MASRRYLQSISVFRCYFLAFCLAGALLGFWPGSIPVRAEEYAEDYAEDNGGDEEWVEEIPDSYYGCPVSVLMDDIFKNHTEIEKVILPDTLTDIGGFVFDGCTSLKHIEKKNP